MRDWHVKHMQDTIIKYLTGLSENATRWLAEKTPGPPKK
jgi:hypothetical protein